jgi:hypothetical protein
MKTKNSFFKFMWAMLLTFALAFIIAPVIGAGILPISSIIISGECLLVAAILAFTIKIVRVPIVLRAGILKEIWLDLVLEGFRDDSAFLQFGKNYDMFVDNNILNLAEAGIDPIVVKNRSVFPSTITPRTDTPYALPLDHYSTDAVVIRNAEQLQIAYDKVKSVTDQHKATLLEKIAQDGHYNIAPLANTANSPLVATSGAVNALGVKTITKDDIANLAKEFDKLKLPKKGRVLLLSPDMYWEFVSTDTAFLNQSVLNSSRGTIDGDFVSYFGFKIASMVHEVTYSGASAAALAKDPAGAIAVPGTNFGAAVAFIDQLSFAHAIGTAAMNIQQDSPTEYGDVISFEMHAMVLPLRQKTIGGIVAMP